MLPEQVEVLKAITGYIPFKFQANIQVKGKKPKIYYLHVSPGVKIIKKTRNKFCLFYLRGNRKDWMKIFSNKRTLIGAYNLGEIKATNIREQYILRLVFFSEVIHTFNQRRLQLVRAKRYLSIFPHNILRAFVKSIITLIRFIPSKLMETFMDMIGIILSRVE